VTDAGPIRAVLLDALGTLVELDPPAPLLRDELARRFGVSLGETEAQRAIAAEIEFYRRHLNQGRDEASLAALRERCAEVLRDALPAALRARLPPAAGLVSALLASLRFRLYPDVRPALAGLRARGLRLAVASNWDVSLHGVLAALGLELDAIVTSAEVGVGKPSPVVFRRALAGAGVSAAEAIHVGDGVEEDVAGARAAGLRAVLVRRAPSASPEGVPVIASLAELPGLLDREWGSTGGRPASAPGDGGRYA